MISSPGCSCRLLSTVLTPWVALLTKVIPSVSAFRNFDRVRRASSHRSRYSLSKNRTGSVSIRVLNRLCSSRMTEGVAPKEPWFRKAVSGSRFQ